MDDILIFSRDNKEHERSLTAVLERLKTNGVTLNMEKCEFFKSELTFLGHRIDTDGIKPDPDKTKAIVNMKAPTDVQELRRFLGMVNQLDKFSRKLAELSEPLRQLLRKNQTWQWTPLQDQSFNAIKKELSQSTSLALYNPLSPTKISADASSYGLGAVLLQKNEERQWKPVAFASRTLSETERRYAQIEKEALATTWACEKFSNYVIGVKFTIETDHKPLVPLLGYKDLDKLPPRILRFRLRMDRFSYNIIHVPGKLMYTADTLSRTPSSETGDTTLQELAEIMVETCVEQLPASRQRIDTYRKAQKEDEICSRVILYCNGTWPNKFQIEHKLRAYWKIRNELTVYNNLLLKGQRIVVPKKLQKETIVKIHQGHQGMERCRLRAKQSVWWPEMSQQIKDYIQQCHTCAKEATPVREPLIKSELPDFPWQKIASDLFTLNGSNYLLVVDYFSRYPEVVKLSSTTSPCVIIALKAIFSRFGIPEILISDNGPQYSSTEFEHFAQSYNFNHITSSPRYPQSNGQAERTVRTIKTLIKQADDPYLAILAYRSTPLPWCNLSPAQLLMGRPLRTTVPQISESLVPKWEYLKGFRNCDYSFKQSQKENYDRTHRTKSQPSIPVGTAVWVTTGNQQVTGRIASPAETPRSYLVETPAGQVRRNRQHLRIIPNVPNTTTYPTPETTNATQRSPIQTRSRTNTFIPPPDRFIPGKEM